MKPLQTLFTIALAISLSSGCMAAPAEANSERGYLLLAQADDARDTAEVSDDEQLKLAALEGLLSASPERALPLVQKVLSGNHSDAVKSRALFVLGQIGTPEANGILMEMASDANQPLRHEAIRMIGIGGSQPALERLAGIYASGTPQVRESVLSAYLIAGEADAVYQLARDATTEDEFDAAVNVLAAMGANEKLRLLANKGGDYKGLIQAYAVSGDLDSLRQIAAQATDPAQRIRAISAIGIVGNSEADAALVDIYRGASDEEIRNAALQGLLISGHDEGVLELFRTSQDAAEKRALLRTLVHMDSDLALDLIDSTLEGN